LIRHDLLDEIECNLAVLGEIFIDFGECRTVVLSDRLEEWGLDVLQEELGDRFERSMNVTNWRVWLAMREHLSDARLIALRNRSKQRLTEMPAAERVRRISLYWRAERFYLRVVQRRQRTELSEIAQKR
jgi:hypothetical protein